MDRSEIIGNYIRRISMPFFYFGHWHQKYMKYKISNDILFKIRPNTFDIFVLFEVWKERQYGNIRSKSVVVDAGAHIGSFSIYASQKAAKVFSLEPNPANFRLFRENLEINKIDNVVPLNLALSDRNGQQSLSVSKMNNGMHSLCGTETNKTLSVKTITLPELIRKHRIKTIDLLKLDIEGKEYDVLFSLDKDTFMKIKKIVLEYHDYLGLSYSRDSLILLLKQNGFSIVRYSNGFIHKYFKQGYIVAVRK